MALTQKKPPPPSRSGSKTAPQRALSIDRPETTKNASAVDENTDTVALVKPAKSASQNWAVVKEHVSPPLQRQSSGWGMSFWADEGPKADDRFLKAQAEIKGSPHYLDLAQRDLDASVFSADYVAYKLENAIGADPNVRFYILIGISAVLCAVLSAAWASVTDEDGDHALTADFWGGVFMTFQVLITGGYDSSIVNTDARILFFLMIAVGVTLISILIGLITDSVNEYMESLSSGTTKVVEEGHTLILGWNEATVRVICQMAFLRRVFQVQNETWERYLLPWRRAIPSTPVAVAPIVCMNDTMEKDDMTELVENAFSERAIDPKRTKLGRDVIFRRGDPCNNHDLVRVGAHKALSVIVMLSAKDEAEYDESPGIAANSATIRCVLSLRNIIFSHGHVSETFQEGLRVVVQLSAECLYMRSVHLLAHDGHECLYPQDLTRFINGVLFACAAKPSLSRVLMALMNFEGKALRCRPPTQLRAGPKNELNWFTGKTMRECLLGHGWKNGILIGCDDAALNQPIGGKKGSGPGIMSDPDRVVLEDDYLVFVSTSSTPTVSFASEDRKDFAVEASALIPKATKDVGHPTSEPIHVIICGWRNEWDANPTRFRDRAADVVSGIAQKHGSTITLINGHSKEDMDAILSKSTLDGSPSSGFSYQGVKVKHFSADPVQLNQVTPLFEGGNAVSYNTAIVLGTVASGKIPNIARDSRVLGILLVLRTICEDKGLVMHAVAENQQDQTSTIALGPTTTSSANEQSTAFESDFVNNQAIVARSLAMNCAYPQMWDAVSEMVNSVEDSPEVEFIEPLNLGFQTGSTCTFGALQHVLQAAYEGHAIAIGYAVKSTINLQPALGEAIKWTSDHRIIAITRRVYE